MPFTLSHPAAVLPLLREGKARGPLVASAMVAGSMAPDVPYFADSLLRGSFGFGVFTHSPAGIVTADVAIAAGLVAGWHWLLREPLVALLPGRWADTADALTAPAGRARGPRTAGWFVVSAALGAATHVGWDAFTHHDRAGVRLLPVLDRTVHGEPVFHLLQYASSVAGLAVIGWYAARVARDTPSPAEPSLRRAPRLPRRARTAALVLIGAAAAGGAAQRLARWDSGERRAAHLLDLLPTAAFGGGTGAAVGLAAYALLARLPAARRLTRERA